MTIRTSTSSSCVERAAKCLGWLVRTTQPRSKPDIEGLVLTAKETRARLGASFRPSLLRLESSRPLLERPREGASTVKTQGRAVRAVPLSAQSCPSNLPYIDNGSTTTVQHRTRGDRPSFPDTPVGWSAPAMCRSKQPVRDQRPGRALIPVSSSKFGRLGQAIGLSGLSDNSGGEGSLFQYSPSRPTLKVTAYGMSQ